MMCEKRKEYAGCVMQYSQRVEQVGALQGPETGHSGLLQYILLTSGLTAKTTKWRIRHRSTVCLITFVSHSGLKIHSIRVNGAKQTLDCSLTPLTQWSRASSQLEAPPSSSAEPRVLTAVTVSIAPMAIKMSITARWALCTNHMGEGKDNQLQRTQ